MGVNGVVYVVLENKRKAGQDPSKQGYEFVIATASHRQCCRGSACQRYRQLEMVLGEARERGFAKCHEFRRVVAVLNSVRDTFLNQVRKGRWD